jgi:hypothetical protein
MLINLGKLRKMMRARKRLRRAKKRSSMRKWFNALKNREPRQVEKDGRVGVVEETS